MINCTDSMTKGISASEGRKLMEVEYVNEIVERKEKQKKAGKVI
jgi:hypothetical protein